MIGSKRVASSVVLGVLVLVACAPASRPQATAGGAVQGAATAGQQPRTLTAAIRVEPAYVAGKGLQQAGLTLGATTRLFNAGLAIIDDRGAAQPYLAESLPQLNTESWQVAPDGRMETVYRLRPGLTWQDGEPLTPEDVIFAWRTYTTPDFGISSAAPQGLIEDVVAQDDRTVSIRWKRPYPRAGILGYGDLPPLPRHILEAALQQNSSDAFVALPFWTTDYIGLGPFKIEHWEPGAYIEASAFGGHALGRSKIDRIKLLFINDANTALASLLSGAVQVLMDDAIYFQQATVIKREWAANQGGSVLVTPGLWRYTQIQLHPERVSPRALTDIRVRKALAYSVDKQAIDDGIYEGQGINSDSVIPPTVDYYAEVDAATVKYPFDVRRTEQLMNEAGFTKGADGFFTSPPGGKLSPELKVIQNSQNEAEQSIMASVWRQAGFDIQEAVLPAAQAQDPQIRATFPSMFTTGGPLGENSLPNLGTAGTPRPENRWNGTNRSSWSNAEYDRLVDAFNTTLDRTERIHQIAQMVHIFSDELPAIAINFNPGITAYVAALHGPQVASPDSSTTWNVHTWELR